LHTFDIHAWIVELGGGRVFETPEKAFFYHRLPGDDEPSNRNIKGIWTSRMYCFDETNGRFVVKNWEKLEGVFEGEDADEVWCGGH
jgi:hypothetical protein